jgi:glycosyltransferase involved in cell wall biosynthesis
MSWDRDVASGITVIAMALAAGRPVIASLTPASLDHVRPGVDGLLVPAGRPDALGAAIRRLLDDDALVRALAAGATEAAGTIGVDGWADELLRGDGARPPVGAPGGPWRPW